MKNYITALFLFLVFIPAFSQNSKSKYEIRFNPSVKKEKLNGAEFVGDITPELWSRLGLPNKGREELEYQRKTGYPLGFYLNPKGGYEVVITYDTVWISAIRNGKMQTSFSMSDKLTKEQKNILNSADPGTDLNIKIKYNYKNPTDKSFGNDGEIRAGNLTVTVVPEIEAEYPGGYDQLTDYLIKNIINKFPEKKAADKIQRAMVKFAINEEGQIVDVKMSRTSGDLNIDKLVVEAVNKMPKWKPAKTSGGAKTKQAFSIPLGNGGGC